MITPDFARRMARYNRWQNDSLYRAADGLTEAQRLEDRGAFFRSIHGTLSHIYWADTIWLGRFTGGELPKRTIAETTTFDGGWAALKPARCVLDQRIAEWAGALTEADLAGDLHWYSGALARNFSAPRWLLVAHMFNHQTHHRGQVHALLTSFGARPDDTDLPFMPEGY
jgi:uncharacterized damage-inducible protein DinB